MCSFCYGISICNVFGVVVRENPNVESVTVLAKENDTLMKGNIEKNTTITKCSKPGSQRILSSR